MPSLCLLNTDSRNIFAVGEKSFRKCGKLSTFNLYTRVLKVAVAETGRSVFILAIQCFVWLKQIQNFVKAVNVKDSEAVFLAPEV